MRNKKTRKFFSALLSAAMMMSGLGNVTYAAEAATGTLSFDTLATSEYNSTDFESVRTATIAGENAINTVQNTGYSKVYSVRTTSQTKYNGALTVEQGILGKSDSDKALHLWRPVGTAQTPVGDSGHGIYVETGTILDTGKYTEIEVHMAWDGTSSDEKGVVAFYNDGSQNGQLMLPNSGYVFHISGDGTVYTFGNSTGMKLTAGKWYKFSMVLFGGTGGGTPNNTNKYWFYIDDKLVTAKDETFFTPYSRGSGWSYHTLDSFAGFKMFRIELRTAASTIETTGVWIDDFSVTQNLTNRPLHDETPPDLPILIYGKYDGLKDILACRCNMENFTLDGEVCSRITGVKDSSNDNDLFMQYILPQVNRSESFSMSISFIPNDTIIDIGFGTRYHTRISPIVQTAELERDRWHTITLISNPASGRNDLYLDGAFYGSEKQSVIDGILRIIVTASTDIKDVSLYMDNYMVCSGEIEFPTIAGKPEIAGGVIYGCKDMTASAVVEALAFPNNKYKAVITDKGTVVADDAVVAENMRLSVWKDGVLISQYYLRDSEYEFKNIVFSSNGYCDTGFIEGECSIELDAANYVRSSDITVKLGQYSADGDSMITEDSRDYSITGTVHISNCISVTDTENTYVKYSVSDKSSGEILLESDKILPYSNTKIEKVSRLYPGFTTKAATFSYDDGITDDMRLISIFDKYGAKGTFNLVGSRLENNYRSVAKEMGMEVYGAVKEVYKNHEIQNHTYEHIPSYLMEGETGTTSTGYPIYGCSLATAVADVTINKAFLTEKLGVTTRGIAWPSGFPQVRTDYDELERQIKAEGYVYARGYKSDNFSLPTDWMQWRPTCHHNNAPRFTDWFIEMPDSGDLKLYYIWGHAYEFADAGSDDTKNWTMIEDTVAKLQNNDVWLPSNGEFYDYMHALDKVERTETEVKNNSGQTVYMRVNGRFVSIEAGESYHVGQDGEQMPPKIQIEHLDRMTIAAKTDKAYGTLLMAAYDRTGRLIRTALSDGTNIGISLKDAATVKAFLFDDMASLMPLRRAVIIDTKDSLPTTIACWGDSLTYGQESSNPSIKSYPAVLAELSRLKVYNMGVCGETATTIAARQGALKIQLSEAVTIPSSGSVQIMFKASNGGIVTPRDVSNGGWNPCVINGVEGELKVEINNTWPRTLKSATFTRSSAGESVTAAAGTEIIPQAHSVVGDINIIFSGTNGGWSPDNLTVDKSANNDGEIKSMIALLTQQTQASDKYIIVGLTINDNAYWTKYDTACEEAFGDKFFNLRNALANEAQLVKMGITPTAEDKVCIQRGAVPPSLLAADGTHFNDDGYRLIGELLYDKMKMLGYL